MLSAVMLPECMWCFCLCIVMAGLSGTVVTQYTAAYNSQSSSRTWGTKAMSARSRWVIWRPPEAMLLHMTHHAHTHVQHTVTWCSWLISPHSLTRMNDNTSLLSPHVLVFLTFELTSTHAPPIEGADIQAQSNTYVFMSKLCVAISIPVFFSKALNERYWNTFFSELSLIAQFTQ